jgi:predicted transcriptional regulator
MKYLFIFIYLISLNLQALVIGETPVNINLKGENGGVVVNNKEWNFKDNINNKLIVMLYIDPDEKDKNSIFIEKLLKDNKKNKNILKIAIINIKASWKPSSMIENYILDKQKENPNIVFVKDNKSILVDKWNLKDNDTNLILFEGDGTVLYYKSGKLNDNDKNDISSIIFNYS